MEAKPDTMGHSEIPHFSFNGGVHFLLYYMMMIYLGACEKGTAGIAKLQTHTRHP